MSRNVGRVQICCRQGRLGAAWRATRGQALGAFARDPSARRLLQDVTSRFVSNGCRKANHLFSRLQRKAVHLRRRGRHQGGGPQPGAPHGCHRCIHPQSHTHMLKRCKLKGFNA